MSGLVKTDYAVRWAAGVTPEMWRDRVLALEEPLRGAVAAGVWWDMFAMRTVADRWPHLDHLLGRADAVPEQVLAAGLVAVGYTPSRAQKRVQQGRMRGGVPLT